MSEPKMNAPGGTEGINLEKKFSGVHDYRSLLKEVSFELRSPSILSYLEKKPLPTIQEYVKQVAPGRLNDNEGTLTASIEKDIREQPERIKAINKAISALNASETHEEAKKRFDILKVMF